MSYAPGRRGAAISLSERAGVELLSHSAPSVPLPPQFVPLLPQLVAVLPGMSEHHLEARQLGFDRRQLGR